MTLKDLRELMTMCRKAGVKEIKVGDVSLVMGEAPQTKPRGRAAQKRAQEESFGEPEGGFAFYSAPPPMGMDFDDH